MYYTHPYSFKYKVDILIVVVVTLWKESLSLIGRQKDSFCGVSSYSSKYLLADIQVSVSEEQVFTSILLYSDVDM